MAITATLLAGSFDETDLSVYTTASIAPTANRLVLLAMGFASGGAQEQPTIAGNGLTWVEVGRSDGGAGTNKCLTIFRAMGAAPSAGTVVATFSATQIRAFWSIVEFAGVDVSGTDGSGAVVQFKSAAGTGTSATADFDAAFGDAVNNGTYSAVLAGTIVTAVTPEAGFTELHDLTTGSQDLETMWRVGEDQTPAPSWTNSVTWNQVVIEIKAAVAQTLTGALFTKAPTFPLGVLTLGAAPTPPSPSTSSNRMGGNKAIRKPPRNVGR